MKNGIYMELSAAERKKRQSTSKKRFAEIYKKTLAVLNMSPSNAPCSSGFQRCWSDILSIWDKYAVQIGCNVLYAAIYHITWDRYPLLNGSGPLMELLCMAEQALLDEGYAYEVWSRHYLFSNVLHDVRYTTDTYSKSNLCHSRWFGEYIFARAYCRIILKNRMILSPVEEIRRVEIRILYAPLDARNAVYVYEETVRRLLPSSANWTWKDWTDENVVMKGILTTHGIDYTQNYEAFDDLVDVFNLMLSGRTYDRKLMLLN